MDFTRLPVIVFQPVDLVNFGADLDAFGIDWWVEGAEIAAPLAQLMTQEPVFRELCRSTPARFGDFGYGRDDVFELAKSGYFYWQHNPCVSVRPMLREFGMNRDDFTDP